MFWNVTGRTSRVIHRKTKLYRVKQGVGALFVAAAMALLASCGSGSGTGTGQPPGQPASTLQITTSRALFPTFDPSITDYVAPYDSASSMQVTVNAPQNTSVSVDGKPFRSLSSTTQVNVTPGQSFSLVVNTAGATKTYYIRSLPTDFPTWTTERLGTPQSEYYIVAPSRALTTDPPSQYAIIFDSYGVPMWWYRAAALPVDVKLFADGNMGWTSAPTGEERKFDGSLVRAVVSGVLGGIVDNHEILLLPNGNYLFIANVRRTPVDFSAFGGSASAVSLDNVVVEAAPDGTVVWQWSAQDHIPVAEMDPQWRSMYVLNSNPADPYHMNAIEPDGDGYIISLRHLNAILRIDRATGNIVWKLGGSQRAESLTFANDPIGKFGGMHDARRLPDGTIALHDNGTDQGRPPRAVRYQIDTAARTATLIEQVTDPDVPSSICCGSARKLSTGNWVMAWGASPYFTELTPDGKRLFRIAFPRPFFTYRASPVPYGTLTRAALRQGMDAQFHR
jgi:hypothetical protein